MPRRRKLTRAERQRFTAGVRNVSRKPMLRMLALVPERLARVQGVILEGLRARRDAEDPADLDFLGARLRSLTAREIESLLDLDSYEDALDSIAGGMLVANTEAVSKLIGTRGLERFDPKLVEAWRKTNTDLIVSLARDQVADLKTNVLEASQGLRVEEIRKSILERFDVSKSRADLIARDQTLKLNAQMSRENYSRAGLRKYIWTTARDERVRGDPSGLYPDADPSHFELDGQEFSFDDPPEPGNPGDDYQCRCTAFPVLDFSVGEDE